ncbi:MAG: recombinase family protein [Scytonema sp. CRU_2_7]|nr:recombinase family protein [Scytonema sp. CRU_2_7]
MKAVILARVSKSTQDFERQVSELRSVAASRAYEVVEEIVSKHTGDTKNENRPDLQRLLSLASTGAMQTVLVSEVSRLGRKTFEILKVLEILTEQGINIYVHNFKIDTLMPDGKRNPVGQLLFMFLSERARAEQEDRSERIKSGIAQARRAGKPHGRKEGKEDEKVFLKRHKKVVASLQLGNSIRATMKVAGVAMATVQKVKKLL